MKVSRRKFLAAFMGSSAVASTAIPAFAFSSTPVDPAMLGSDTAGQYPGDGTYRPLRPSETFINHADGTFAWLDAGGSQRRVSFADLRTPAYFGAKGDGVTDDTVALNGFFASGKGFIKPTNAFYLVTSTLNIPAGGEFYGPPAAIIKLVLAAGAPAVPLVQTDRWSVGQAMNIRLTGGVTFDHNAASLGNPNGGGTAVAAGSCIIWRAGYSEVQVTVKNGWDDGILVADYDWVGNTYPSSSSGTPPGVLLHDGRSINCGCGYHTVGALVGRNGAGIDLADAGNFIVSGWTDYGSAGAIGTDTGGGAYGTIVGCVSNVATLDASNPTNGSGLAFVVQSPRVTVSGCVSYFAGRNGFVAFGSPDGTAFVESGADGSTFSSCCAFYSGQDGFLISAPRVSLSSCHSYAPGRSFKPAAFIGAISGTTLTVSAIASGALAVGQAIIGSGITTGTIVSALGTGTGGTGTYTVSASQTIASEAMTSSGWGGFAVRGTFANVVNFTMTGCSALDLGDGYMGYEYREFASTPGPYGNGTSYTISGTLLGGLNSSGISTLGITNYWLEAGAYHPSIVAGLFSASGAVYLSGLPTSSSGLTSGRLWRDNSTTPSTVRIV